MQLMSSILLVRKLYSSNKRVNESSTETLGLKFYDKIELLYATGKHCWGKRMDTLYA
jgi:hypothetical protein